jgi:hypothetical protein
MRARPGLPAKRLSLLLLAVLGGTPGVGAAETCHVHPPASEDDPAPALIGPFPDAANCESERAGRFGPLGRCHCTAAFTPGWLGDGPPGRASAEAPAGIRVPARSLPGPSGAGQDLPLP